MADKQPLPGEQFAPRPPAGDFALRKFYVKDVSFETPNSPAVFAEQWAPEVDVNLRTEVKQLEPGEFEVTLSITATVNVSGRTAFLVEVQQAGVFGIVGLTSDEMGPVLGAYCPSMLYPYAREVVSDLVVRGGFPPFILSPVDFDALYRRQLAESASSTQAAPPTGG